MSRQNGEFQRERECQEVALGIRDNQLEGGGEKGIKYWGFGGLARVHGKNFGDLEMN